MRPRQIHAGFTSIELMFVMAIGLLTLLVVMRALGTSRSLEEATKSELLLEQRARANVNAIVDVLRNVPVAELGGFDEHDQTDRPTLRRIVDASGGSPVLGDAGALEWRATTGGRSDDTGGVFLVEGADVSQLAWKVPENGFQVEWKDPVVVVRLKTQRLSADGGQMIETTTRTVVGLRN